METDRPSDDARRTGPAVEAMYRFVLWTIPTVEKLPRGIKFTLGERIHDAALGALEALIAATYTKRRAGHLERANLEIDKLRFLFRLAKDLHHLDLRRYEFAARGLDEVGRLIGGWRRADHAVQG